MKKAILAVLAAFGASAATAQSPTAVAHVTITGGANPGTYTLSVARAGCSSGSVGKGSFGTQISDTKATVTALGSVQLAIPTPSAAGSTDFQLIVRFGTLMKKGAEFQVNTLASARTPVGKGKVSVKDAGSTAAISFDATTADGVHLVGTVDCKSVIRM